MGRFVVLQPDKKFAIWSSITDDFIYENLTEQEVIELHRNNLGEQFIEIRLEIIKRGEKPNHSYPTYDEAQFRKFIAYSPKKELLEHFLSLCKGKKKEEIAHLLATTYGHWMYLEQNGLFFALIDYVPVVANSEPESNTFDRSVRLLKFYEYL